MDSVLPIQADDGSLFQFYDVAQASTSIAAGGLLYLNLSINLPTGYMPITVSFASTGSVDGLTIGAPFLRTEENTWAMRFWNHSSSAITVAGTVHVTAVKAVEFS